MNTTRRTVLQGMLTAGAMLQAAAAAAQAPAGRQTAEPRAANAATPIAKNPRYKRIATEEAWITREIAEESKRLIASNPPDQPGFVAGDGRIAAMDRLGIDMQVLAITGPGVQVFDADTATALAADSNDQLAEAIAKHPDRFAGLTAVAPQDPARAARELERGMQRLGMK